MTTTIQTFLGISLSSGQRHFSLAAIDENQHILALSQGNTDDIVAFAAGQTSALVAVNIPAHSNLGLMANNGFRQTLSPPPPPGRWEDLRVAEYELIQMGVHVVRTHSITEANPSWLQKGFEVRSQLTGLGYESYPGGEQSKQIFESHTEGFFYSLTGKIPFDGDTLEGRLQRQLILYEQDMDVYDPMRFFEEVTRHRLIHSVLPLESVYSPNELNALAMAQMAWMLNHHPENTMSLGLPDDGLIYLPKSEGINSSAHQATLP
jgi:hypothetical protein